MADEALARMRAVQNRKEKLTDREHKQVERFS